MFATQTNFLKHIMGMLTSRFIGANMDIKCGFQKAGGSTTSTVFWKTQRHAKIDTCTLAISLIQEGMSPKVVVRRFGCHDIIILRLANHLWV